MFPSFRFQQVSQAIHTWIEWFLPDDHAAPFFQIEVLPPPDPSDQLECTLPGSQTWIPYNVFHNAPTLSLISTWPSGQLVDQP